MKRLLSFLLAFVLVFGVSSQAFAVRSINVTASNNTQSGKPRLTWQAVSGADCYEVYRANYASGAYTKYFTTANLSYTNTSANAGYTYYYKVSAFDADGTLLAKSETISRTCDCARVSKVVVTNGDDGYARLSWSAVKGATSYKVYRSGYKNGTYKLLCNSRSVSYKDTSARLGCYYYYKVVACLSKSVYADSAPYRLTAAPAPHKPNTPTYAYDKNSQCRLRWEKISGASGYVLLVGNSTGALSAERDLGNTSSFNITSLIGKYHYFAVAAYVVLSDGSVVMSKPSSAIHI